MAIAGETFLSLQEEVLAHQFSPSQYRDLVKVWLNRAQRIAAVQAELRTQVTSQAITTTASDASYALSEDFGRIIDYFVAEYTAARTPNPCVMCNNWLKFGKLFDYADSVGAESPI